MRSFVSGCCLVINGNHLSWVSGKDLFFLIFWVENLERNRQNRSLIKKYIGLVYLFVCFCFFSLSDRAHFGEGGKRVGEYCKVGEIFGAAIERNHGCG